MQWALRPSWDRRFTQCAVGLSSLLREDAYLVCSGPLIPPERGGLPDVQWALNLSLLREEVYLVCSGPFITPERGSLPSVQWAPDP